MMPSDQMLADIRENPQRYDVVKVGNRTYNVFRVEKRLDGQPWMVECRTVDQHGDVFINYFQMRHWRARCDKADAWSR